MNMSKQLDIIVSSHGDPHAGIPSEHWVIDNIGFVYPEDREEVRQAFADAFALIADGAQVMFSDELPPEPEHED